MGGITCVYSCEWLMSRGVVAFAIMLISIVYTKFSPFILLYVSARESQCESSAIVSVLADISSVNCTHIIEDVWSVNANHPFWSIMDPPLIVELSKNAAVDNENWMYKNIHGYCVVLRFYGCNCELFIVHMATMGKSLSFWWKELWQ